MNYLDLGDFLVIAEAVTGIPAETLERLPRLALAESALAAPAAGSAGRSVNQHWSRRRPQSAIKGLGLA